MADTKIVRLMDIPRESKIRVPLYNKETDECTEDTITFHRLDGMYSYCKTSAGDVVHLGTMQPLTLAEDGTYDLAPEPEEG